MDRQSAQPPCGRWSPRICSQCGQPSALLPALPRDRDRSYSRCIDYGLEMSDGAPALLSPCFERIGRPIRNGVPCVGREPEGVHGEPFGVVRRTPWAACFVVSRERDAAGDDCMRLDHGSEHPIAAEFGSAPSGDEIESLRGFLNQRSDKQAF